MKKHLLVHVLVSLALTGFSFAAGAETAKEAPPASPGAERLKPLAAADDPVVARVGATEIRRSEVEGIWARIDAETKKIFEAQGGMRALLRDIAGKKRIVLDAEKKGLAALPEVRLDFSVAYDSILYDRYAERQILPEMLPDADLRLEYEKRKETFHHPARWRARHILVTAVKEEKLRNRNADDATTPEAAKKKIDFLNQRVKDGADFETLAREFSEDPTSEKGGDLGLFAKGAMVAEFEAVLDTLKPGEISEPVKTPYGYHLIQLLEREPEGHVPFETVAQPLRAQLTSDRGEEIQRRLAERAMSLEKDYPLTIVEPSFQAK